MRSRGIALMLAASLPGIAQHGSTNVVNPYTGPEHVEAGAKLFRSQCAGCHGRDGAGTTTGPNLTTGTFQRGGSDEALFQTITKGVPGTTMPAFSLTGLQTWQLVTHLRTLPIARGASPAKGNRQSGAVVFQSNCAGCHAVGREGGFQGPDLTAVASRRSLAELHTAVTDPDAHVSPEYWSVQIKTTSGKTLRGTRLNEDTHSLQLRDESGRLFSVLKRDVAEHELIRRSPMGVISGKLSEAQINDVLAYLVTLRGVR
jgi:putative heme-binding domain-containing protein